jgi:hypothetical protein
MAPGRSPPAIGLTHGTRKFPCDFNEFCEFESSHLGSVAFPASLSALLVSTDPTVKAPPLPPAGAMSDARLGVKFPDLLGI